MFIVRKPPVLIPRVSARRQPVVTVRAYPVHDVVELSYYVGKGITLFTMFYCTLNWWHYKRMREDKD